MLKAEKKQRLRGLPKPLLRRRAMRAKRRRNLLYFVKATHPGYQAGWVHKDICRRLERFSEAVTRGESPRMMIFMPPRHGKSFLASERFPAWHLGRNPSHDVIVAGYSLKISLKRSRATQRVVKGELYQETFPEFELDPSRNAAEEWETTDDGSYMAVGVDGGATGMGANILIIDDPIKGWKFALSPTVRETVKNWYRTDAYTRLAPGGGVLIIQTRWHEDDLGGWLEKLMKSGDGDSWEIVSYPAIAEEDEKYRKKGEALHPARFPLEALKKIRKVAGPYGWPALYQQRPTALGGNLWKESWFRYYRHVPNDFERIIQSWDLTFKDKDTSDFVAGQVWGVRRNDKGERLYYLLHREHARMDIIKALERIEAVTELYPETDEVLIEDKANGPAMLRLLRGRIAGLVPVEPQGSKIERMVVASTPIEDKRVFLPHESIAPWIHEYIEEVTKVPAAPHDDEADASSQAIIYLEEEGEGVPIF